MDRLNEQPKDMLELICRFTVIKFVLNFFIRIGMKDSDKVLYKFPISAHILLRPGFLYLKHGIYRYDIAFCMCILTVHTTKSKLHVMVI